MLEGRTLVYYSNGAIADIFYFHGDSSEGVQRRFYPNGKLMSWQQMHRGVAHGDYYGFLKDGALALIEHHTAGFRTGRNKLFYEHPRNRLHKEIEWLVVEGKPWQNSYAEYDTLGRVLTRQGFPRSRAARDTISLGDSLHLQLRLPYPQHPLIAAVLGDFDPGFRLHDPKSLRRVMGRNHAVEVYVPAKKTGPQVVRGYLADFWEKPRRGKKDPAQGGVRIYFSHEYFVQ